MNSLSLFLECTVSSLLSGETLIILHVIIQVLPPQLLDPRHCLSFLVAQMVKNLLQCRRYGFKPWIRKIPWKREWQSTPVFLPGKFHGQRILVAYSPWGCKESDKTEQLTLLSHFQTLTRGWSYPPLRFLELYSGLSYTVQHFHSIIFQDLKELNWNSIISTSFVRSNAF